MDFKLPMLPIHGFQAADAALHGLQAVEVALNLVSRCRCCFADVCHCPAVQGLVGALVQVVAGRAIVLLNVGAVLCQLRGAQLKVAGVDDPRHVLCARWRGQRALQMHSHAGDLFVSPLNPETLNPKP